ncbi:MAG: arginine--tRNA ligase, partial [Bacillota bacterium]|nr:arginine--tRNA ligase [Bacillota bacterium]
DKMDAVVSELKEKNLLTESEGAMIVTFDDMPPAIILKQDGSTIYATRDLAAAIYRKNTYNFYKNIYVVGLPQTLHFKQIFATLKKMGKDFADDCIHVGFGTVKFPDRAMSTRNGDVVLLETVIDEAVKKTGEIMKENGNINNIDEVASKVGIGAIFYTFLKNSREKDIIFQWDDILDFNGESGPYVQYSYARGMSVLSKADNKVSAAVFDYEITDEEYTLSKLISEFAQVVIDAANKNEPFYITRYVTNVAKAFNKFYNTSPILKAEENIKNARLALTKASCITIKNALSLLGIEVVNKM